MLTVLRITEVHFSRSRHNLHSWSPGGEARGPAVSLHQLSPEDEGERTQINSELCNWQRCIAVPSHQILRTCRQSDIRKLLNFVFSISQIDSRDFIVLIIMISRLLWIPECGRLQRGIKSNEKILGGKPRGECIICIMCLFADVILLMFHS